MKLLGDRCVTSMHTLSQDSDGTSGRKLVHPFSCVFNICTGTILDKLLFGLGTVVTGPFHINGPDYDKSIMPCPYDPEAAAALLKEAGWEDHDGDSTPDKDGAPFSFEFLLSSGWRFVGFANAEADKLIEEARQELDPEKRRRIYHRFHQIVHEEQPCTFFFTMESLVAVSRRFQNVHAYPMGIAPREWWVRKSLRRYTESEG